MSLVLTQKAAVAVKDIMKQHDYSLEGTRLRVAVKGGGCSGFTYMLDLVEESRGEEDEQLESNGIQILVDMRSNLYLTETEIDFKEGVMGNGFAFKSSGGSSSCGGCGSSTAA